MTVFYSLADESGRCEACFLTASYAKKSGFGAGKNGCASRSTDRVPNTSNMIETLRWRSRCPVSGRNMKCGAPDLGAVPRFIIDPLKRG